MNKQLLILIFLIFFTTITIFLYLWKAKKEIDYKNDERWQAIQNKSNNIAGYLRYVLIVFLAFVEVITLFFDIQITFTLNNILTYALLLIGLRNTVELFLLKYFDTQM